MAFGHFIQTAHLEINHTHGLPSLFGILGPPIYPAPLIQDPAVLRSGVYLPQTPPPKSPGLESTTHHYHRIYYKAPKTALVPTGNPYRNLATPRICPAGTTAPQTKVLQELQHLQRPSHRRHGYLRLPQTKVLQELQHLQRLSPLRPQPTPSTVRPSTPPPPPIQVTTPPTPTCI